MTTDDVKKDIVLQCEKIFYLPAIFFALIFVGIFLRLYSIAQNRSFHIDEAYLALDILVRSVLDIFSGKMFAPDTPAPPAGFSLVTKFFVETFGHKEKVFRIFPFLSGCATLVLFYRLLQKWMSAVIASALLGLFVL